MTQMSNREPDPARSGGCCTGITELLEPRFFKALCDPSRIALLIRLAQCCKPCTVSEMAKCCPTDLSVVSRHLAMLRDAGILNAQKRGKEVFYSVRYAELVATLRAMADAIDLCCVDKAVQSGSSPRTEPGARATGDLIATN